MPPSTLAVPSSGVSTNICRKERASSLAVAAGITNSAVTSTVPTVRMLANHHRNRDNHQQAVTADRENAAKQETDQFRLIAWRQAEQQHPHGQKKGQDKAQYRIEGEATATLHHLQGHGNANTNAHRRQQWVPTRQNTYGYAGQRRMGNRIAKESRAAQHDQHTEEAGHHAHEHTGSQGTLHEGIRQGLKHGHAPDQARVPHHIGSS